MMHPRWKIPVILVLLAVVVIFALFWRWLDMIPFGIAVAVVAAPVKNRLDRRLPGWLSALAITLATLLLLSVGILGTIRAMQANLATNEEILGRIASGVEGLMPQLTLIGIPESTVHAAVSGIEGSIQAIAGFWFGLSFSSVILSPRVALFFLSLGLALWRGEAVLRAILPRMPPAWLSMYPHLAAAAVDTLYAVIVVHLLIVGLTFGMSVPFFWILGYGHVLYLSLVTAFCELVPVLGASIPMAILASYALVLGDLRGFLLVFFIGYLVVALLPEVTVRPILMGRRTLLSPVLMFVSFIGGIVLLGVAGFLLGPLLVAVGVTWYRLRREGKAGDGAAGD